MHPPTVILSLFSLAITAHMLPPQPPHPHILPRSSEPTTLCTFTLWHKQLSPSSTTSLKTNYIYLPAIASPATNLILNVAASKPAQAHNSYSRLSATQKFSVRGLPGDEALTISGRDGEDELVFETESARWMVGGEAEKEREEGKKAECWGGEWIESGVNRERKLECAFPCKKMEEEAERVELK
ncbi:hypothetical protein yc1106_09213 [Curvularia clavata]|uniref:Uncharacterized protein n=1 Tax=Curvularia clavata TaxID=95742 RepID=A0A9Q9DXI3_CURCL|nr:hypothetical protein yc1106_09213 [Curvularia clavata]